MLAKPTKGVTEVLDRFADCAFTCEYKYDGERAQVHLLQDQSVKIFSRSSLDDTHKFPDVTDSFASLVAPGVTSCIIDAECVAYDRELKQIKPFQELSRRSKKNEDGKEEKIKVALFAFDLLYLNGESLIKKPFRERRELLRKSLIPTEGKLHFAVSSDAADTDEIGRFLEEAVQG